MLDFEFKKCVDSNPTSTALVVEDGSRSVTYYELNKRADKLTVSINNMLSNSNMKDSPMISIMIDRDIGMVVAILAVLKVGGAYVPVDPSFPPDRQSHIFSHSCSQILITDPSIYDTAKSLGVSLPPVILIDSKSGSPLDEQGASDGSKRVTRSRRGEDLAYVLYTSGSTGKPKGVMVTHEGVVNIVNWFARELSIKPADNVLGLTTFCFDISVLEMFLPLLHGATLVVARSASQKDPFNLLDVIANRKVNIMQATPTTYEMMLATGWTGDRNIDFLVCV